MPAGYNKLTDQANVLSQPLFDANWNNVESSSTNLDGWRLISGFTITAGTGLTVNISAGTAHIKRYISSPGATALGGFVNGLNYVYLMDDETFLVTVSASRPGQAAAFLGTVVMAVGTVDTINQLNADWALRFLDAYTFVFGENTNPPLKIDLLNRRVGIGVTTPLYALDVANAAHNGFAHFDGGLYAQLTAAPTAITGKTWLYMRAGDVYAKGPDGTEYKVFDTTLHEPAGLTGKVTNAGSVVSIQAGTQAARPAFGTANRWYWATDTKRLYLDTGSAWSLMSIAYVEDMLTASTDTTKVYKPNGSGGTQVTNLVKVDIPEGGINVKTSAYTATVVVGANTA